MSKTCALSVTQIESYIRERFTEDYWFSELRVGCGYGNDGEREMDMWGISCKRPFEHVAIEIKRSRGDFRKDLKSPLKQRRARLLANQFFYAAPSGLLTAADLPPWAGLIEIGPASVYNDKIMAQIAVPAPWFDSSPPTWSFVANLVRTIIRRYDSQKETIELMQKELDAFRSMQMVED